MSQLSEHVLPANLSREEIDGFAETLANRLNLLPGGDIQKIVSELGGRIDKRHDAEHEGEIEVKGEREFTVRLPSYARGWMKRFILAHEIGHYVLHSRFGELRIRVANDGEENRVETEANMFAFGLLMPAAAFTQAWEDCRHDPAAIAEKFGVSLQAAAARCEALNLIAS